MREKLITYVDFLFAGAPRTPETAETKAEILQNTLDKFDDLIKQGKSPEAAYSLAVAGIGDVSELLAGGRISEDTAAPAFVSETRKERAAVESKCGIMRAIAIGLYITCVLPPIFTDGTRFEDNLGPALMFVMIAVATALMVLQHSMRRQGTVQGQGAPASWREDFYSPQRELRRAVTGAVWVLGMVAYFILSFSTMAWHLTWLVFPICGVTAALIRAILDLTGGDKQ